MISKMSKWLVAAVVLASAACASKPDIPEDEKPRDYASTSGGGADTTADDAAKPEVEELGTQTGVPTPKIPRATGPIATIDGTEVPAEDFNVEIRRVLSAGMPPAMIGAMQGQIIQSLVDRKLIDLEIAAQEIVVADAEVDAKLDEVKQQIAAASAQKGADTSLEALVAQLGITLEELRESISQSVAIEKILKKRGMADPDEKSVRKFYDDNKAQFERPEQVRVRHILIKVEPGANEKGWADAKARADVIQAEAKKSKDFAALAKEKSEGPSATNGGDLDFFSRGQMVPAFETAAFALDVGAVSEPVRTQFGWHVIKMEEKRAAGLVPFEDVSEQLSTQMKNEAVQASLTQFLEEIRGQHDVKILDANITNEPPQGEPKQ